MVSSRSNKTTSTERILEVRRVTVPNAAMPPEVGPNHHQHQRRILDGTDTTNTFGFRTHKQLFFLGHQPGQEKATLPTPPPPRPSLSEGRDGGIFIPPCIARRASLSRHFLVPNLALFSLFHVATATALRKLSKRRILGGRRSPRRLWNRGLLARHKAGRGAEVFQQFWLQK